MTSEMTLHQQFRLEIIGMACRMHQQMEDDDDAQAYLRVKEEIDAADLAVGVFRDDASADGFGMRVIKGMVALIHNRAAISRVAAIPCYSREQAFTAWRDLGDGRATLH